MSINRRDFLGWAGIGTAASTLWTAIAPKAIANRFTQQPISASASSTLASLENNNCATSYQFPKDFIWGVATSAYQIEGAVNEGGRQPSVWDTFSAIPGRIKDGSTASVACDHYHRYKSDVKLMAELGVKHYRFSIAWPRIIPDGRGQVNEQGVDFYKRLLDELNKYDIIPHATLFHWDSPQALEDRYGSWRSREMASDFADYVTAVVTRLGDRITHWMTINEISQFTHLGYGVNKQPNNAPGTRVSSQKEVWQTSHNALLAHGLGCQAIRAASPRPCSVALVIDVGSTIPLTESAPDIAAAQQAFHTNWFNGGITFPALTGTYSPIMLEQLGSDAPEIHSGNLKTIHQPLDSFGINLYTGSYVRAADNKDGYEVLDFPKSYLRMYATWIKYLPDSMYWAIRHVSDTLGRKDLPVFISENGCVTQDELNDNGEVIDTDRILYLRQYLRAAHRAISEGYPLNGYFLWSFMDNFEWGRGYTHRFGILYTDYKTQRRIPKASFDWYKECIRHNRIV